MVCESRLRRAAPRLFRQEQFVFQERPCPPEQQGESRRALLPGVRCEPRGLFLAQGRDAAVPPQHGLQRRCPPVYVGAPAALVPGSVHAGAEALHELGAGFGEGRGQALGGLVAGFPLESRIDVEGFEGGIEGEEGEEARRRREQKSERGRRKFN